MPRAVSTDSLDSLDLTGGRIFIRKRHERTFYLFLLGDRLPRKVKSRPLEVERRQSYAWKGTTEMERYLSVRRTYTISLRRAMHFDFLGLEAERRFGVCLCGIGDLCVFVRLFRYLVLWAKQKRIANRCTGSTYADCSDVSSKQD